MRDLMMTIRKHRDQAVALLRIEHNQTREKTESETEDNKSPAIQRGDVPKQPSSVGRNGKIRRAAS
jgi:hypothetical protein